MLMGKIGTSSGMCARAGGEQRSIDKPWYNDELRTLKRHKEQLLKEFRRENTSDTLNDYLESKRLYQHACAYNKNHYQEQLKEDLMNLCKNNNSNGFWQKIKGCLSWKRPHIPDLEENTWLSYFKDLLNPAVEFDDLDFSVYSTTYVRDHNLDCQKCEYDTSQLNVPITVTEIKDAIKKMKNGKASGEDMIPLEFYKVGIDKLMPVLLKLFNTVFFSGTFPESWTSSIILPLHKKGDRNNPGNYRGISLLNSISKIFVSILKTRLTLWSDEQSLIVEEQAGFREGYSTIDNMFILNALIQKYLSKSKCGIFYCAFIDFRKAFDCINRCKLFYLLIKNDIHGPMIATLQSIYHIITAKIRINGNLSTPFTCNSGVRQGCILSPWLFGMYINELIEMLKTDSGHEIFINNSINDIFALLFADDLTLFAETVGDLQKRLNMLDKYCLKWNMSMNVDKSNVVVFKNGGGLSHIEKWYYRGIQMKTVNHYKYLGIMFTSRLKWSSCCKTLALHASKSLNTIKHCMLKLGNRNCTLAFKLFDAMVAPILYYGSEIWGLSFQPEIESVQNSFCKWLTCTGQKTTNAITRAGCGRYELSVNYMCRPIKYFLKLKQMENHRLPRQCYEMLYNLDLLGRTNWCSDVKLMLYRLGFGYVWNTQGVGDTKHFMSVFKMRLQDINFQDRHTFINQSSICEFYSDIKTELFCEPYLNSNLSHVLKFALANLRCSTHTLSIEMGRRSNTPRDQRLCNICNMHKMENEFHFILVCPVLRDLRLNFLPVYCHNNPSEYKLRKLFQCKSEFVYKNLAIYIKLALDVRKVLNKLYSILYSLT
ncbi:hypothetical protein SNE40_009702 [Patella caerulea]|uniref:Reverse transcriptase domain-containing protein n=1 Tax=Patella caerulea TaxID=87958 RepID=A0AAN8JUM1_PATCE